MDKPKKTAICAYVQPEILARLNKICGIEETTQAKLLSKMIRSYKPVAVVEDVEPLPVLEVIKPEKATTPKQLAPIVKPKIEPVKSEPKKFNLAEALAAVKEK